MEETSADESERYRRELYRITSETGVDSDEKLRRLLELGCERFGVENGHIVRIDREADRHEILLAAGSDFVRGDEVTPLEESYCRRTIETDDILAIYSAPAEGWSDDPAYREWDIGCYIGAKIRVRDELFGTLCFVNRRPRGDPFTREEKAFVDLMSRWVSNVFERRRNERERRRHRERLVALNEFSRDVTAAETEARVLEMAVDAANETLSLPVLAAYRYDEQAGGLSPAARSSAAAELGDELFDADRSVPWRVFADQAAATYDRLVAETGVSETATSLRSAIAVPLGDHGVFLAGATTPDAFSETDASLAEMLAETARSALDRVQRERTLRERTDALADRNATLERAADQRHDSGHRPRSDRVVDPPRDRPGGLRPPRRDRYLPVRLDRFP
ncbi:hypothetical protein BRC82_00505 [Halobacteriales archaeon QS_1_67_19]|nr:MAG: hypothetical protein BRC82_00505 [Halobacteriales archaeon QS_1_67_19]